jgi:hypothetical protein
MMSKLRVFLFASAVVFALAGTAGVAAAKKGTDIPPNCLGQANAANNAAGLTPAELAQAMGFANAGQYNKWLKGSCGIEQPPM